MTRSFITAAALAAALAACSGGAGTDLPLASGTAAAGDPGYAYKLTVEKLQFDWRVDGGDLRVKLKAPAQGWLSAGFDPARGMQGARMVIGLVENGKPVVAEHHGIDPKHHKPDTELGGENNVRDASASLTDRGLEIAFTIPLKSPDKLDKPIDPANALLLLAYGETSELAQQHPFWAAARVNLLTGAYTQTLAKRGKR